MLFHSMPMAISRRYFGKSLRSQESIFFFADFLTRDLLLRALKA